MTARRRGKRITNCLDFQNPLPEEHYLLIPWDYLFIYLLATELLSAYKPIELVQGIADLVNAGVVKSIQSIHIIVLSTHPS